MITPENLASLDYTPETGTQYQVAEGCIRSLKKRTYDVQRAFDSALAKENVTQVDPTADDYPENVRIECLEICSDGDPLPKNLAGVDLDIVGRLVADFFSLRILRSKPRSAASQINGEATQKATA